VLVLGADKMVKYGLAKEVVKNDAELERFFGATHMRRLHASWSERMVAFLRHPAVRGVLIVIFLLAMFVEMSSPGIVLPGAVAAVALVALLAPPLLLGMANWWEVAAIIGGIFLIILEIFIFPGFGVPGVVGLLLLFGGLVGTFTNQGSGGLFPDSAQGQTDMLKGLASVVLAFATSGVGMYFIAKHFVSLPFLGKLVLRDAPAEEDTSGDPLLAVMAVGAEAIKAGAVGLAMTPLRPAGKAQFGDKLVDVVAGMGFINENEKVKIVEVTPFRIVVERAPREASSA